MEKTWVVIISAIGFLVCFFIFSVFVFNSTPLGEAIERLEIIQRIIQTH